MLKKYLIIVAALLIGSILLVGCAGNANGQDIIENSTGSIIVSGAEARALLESDGSVILLDVRSQDEFDDHHIEGSILIPYTELESRLSELPDKNAIIIVFCRAGRRSAIAAEILVTNGYTNVYDMQEVTNWPEPLGTAD